MYIHSTTKLYKYYLVYGNLLRSIGESSQVKINVNQHWL
jgi:hypothetical protein